MEYVRRQLWSSGEFGRSVCRRGWLKPDVWALAPAEAPLAEVPTGDPGAIARAENANDWLDRWVMAQGEASQHLCLVARDLLAPPVDADSDIFDSPARWDMRGEESYLVVQKDALAPGAVQAATRQMIGEEYILFVIEGKWPFGETQSLQDLVYGVRHVIVPIAEGESYGIVSGA